MTRVDDGQIVAATAADEGYKLPLAVTVRSAIDALGPASRLRLYVLDGGLSDESREGLERSWSDPRVTIEWLRPDVDRVGHLPVSQHVSVACYLRLLLPELLPADVGKLVYFDSDMLIKRDLGALYAEPLGDDLALAVQESIAPWIDAEATCPNYERAFPYLAASFPVPNHRELGLRPDAPYFNSGLLVLDAARWREEEVGRRALQCLLDNEEHVLWWDQYALNVVLHDRWRPVDPRWNQTAGVFQYPSWRDSPYGRAEFQRLKREPWIVHYCSPTKPWHGFCDHPYRRDFFRTLDRTEWRGWRPRVVNAPDAPSGWKQFRRKVRRSIKSAAAAVVDRLDRAA